MVTNSFGRRNLKVNSEETKGFRVLCVKEEKTFAWKGLKIISNVTTKDKVIYTICVKEEKTSAWRGLKVNSNVTDAKKT